MLSLYIFAVVAFLLWMVLGVCAIGFLRLKSAPREIGFKMEPGEALISIAGVLIIFFLMSFSIIDFLTRKGMDQIYASIVATFIMQLANCVFLIVLPLYFKSKPKFFDFSISGSVKLVSFFTPFVKGALLSFAILMPLYLVAFSWKLILELVGIDAPQQDIAGVFMATHTPAFRAMLVVSMLVLAPLWEELFFRAGFYGALKFKLGYWPAALLSSVLFGLIHSSLFAFVPIALLGFFFVFLYEKYGDIRVPIGAHFMFNFMNMLLLIYAPQISDI
jgi:membrane protease YdiL (CAAX protease family)